MAKEIMWIAGYPSAGKTFLGDYLQTRGWHHIDGDMGNQTPDANVRKQFIALITSMEAVKKGETCPDTWKPYYGHLLNEMQSALEKHDKVVLSFAIMGGFSGDLAFVRERFPDIRFVYVQCDKNILVDRFFNRNAQIM